VQHRTAEPSLATPPAVNVTSPISIHQIVRAFSQQLAKTLRLYCNHRRELARQPQAQWFTSPLCAWAVSPSYPKSSASFV
jgi:hypothetical protein